MHDQSFVCIWFLLHIEYVFTLIFEGDILGCTDTPFLATCRTRIPARLIRLRCPSGVVFFFFFLLLRHGADMPAVEKKIKKNSRFWQMDKSMILWYTLEWEVRNLKSETHTAQLLISLCLLSSVPRGHYIGPIGELPLSLCPFRSLSLLAWTGPSFSSLSLFRDLFIYYYFFFFSFFYLLLWTFGLVYCGVLYL